MAEKEYIEREAAIKARGRSCDRDCSKCDFAIEGDSWCDGEVFVVDLLRIPAADVRPVVRADWKQIGKRQMRFACSKCNSLNEKPTCFCPNCGADMRQEPPKEE